MTNDLVFKNAQVVLRDEIVHGNILIRAGKIADISTGSVTVGEDLDGDYVLPGVVELHTDHVEYHMRPRPGVEWEPMSAVLAHDAQMAAAGATTVLDAVRLGSEPRARETTTAAARRLMGAIRGAREAGAFRADHAAHLRCEVSAEDCFDVFAELVDEPNVLLVSLMDHTPGQRQFEDVDQFRKYFVGKGMVPESEVETYIEELLREADRHTEANRNRISQSALQQGIAVATHDDATAAHVDEAVQLGVSISEFPTSVAAAEAAVQNGLYVVMGAPNIVRGGSQSGNVAAHELLDRGLLHILSSDYVPASPLQAVFQLVDEGSITLSEGTELVSTNPAKAVGLEDRGQIAVGKRADLIRVREIQVGDRDMSSAKQSMPVVRAVFREGMRVA